MSPIASLPPLARRLAASSTGYRDPVAEVDWGSLDPSRPWMPDEMVSLWGLAEWEALAPEQRRRLSQYELIAFLELGLWLEGLFMQRLAGRVGRGAGGSSDDLAYQLHELREEAGHSLMFVELIRRSGLRALGGGIRRPRLAGAFGRLAPFDSTGFWVAILIGEAVPDQISRALYRDERLPEAVRQVVGIHRQEEARHIAYARQRVGAGLGALSSGRRWLLGILVNRILGQFIGQCFYPPPAVYAAAGLPRPRALARKARGSPYRARIAERCAAPTVDFLEGQGLPLRQRGGSSPRGVDGLN